MNVGSTFWPPRSEVSYPGPFQSLREAGVQPLLAQLAPEEQRMDATSAQATKKYVGASSTMLRNLASSKGGAPSAGGDIKAARVQNPWDPEIWAGGGCHSSVEQEIASVAS